MFRRALSLGLIAVLAVVLAGSTPAKPGIADSGYALQAQGQGTEQRHDRGDFLPLLDIAGVIFTDAEGDVVTVGVHRSEECNGVREKGKQLGIALLECKETQPIVPAATLQETVRPLQAGLQIQFVKFPFIYICTLGFNAGWSGVDGYVVNSHCTSKGWAVDGTKHYQATYGNGNLIGNEIADSKTTACGKKKCSFADAAFDQRAAGVTADLGFIERTDSVNTGSLTIAGSFGIVAEAPPTTAEGLGAARVHEVLNKVGRTTGWTQGTVTYSCANVNAIGGSPLLLCQDVVAAGVGAGDSGSPVFKLTDNPSNVTLYGILWGGCSDNSCFVYSPIANVQKELGPLTKCATGGC